MFIKTLLLLTAVAATYAKEDDHSSHGDGSDSSHAAKGWEWSGIFTMPEMLHFFVPSTKMENMLLLQ